MIMTGTQTKVIKSLFTNECTTMGYISTLLATATNGENSQVKCHISLWRWNIIQMSHHIFWRSNVPNLNIMCQISLEILHRNFFFALFHLLKHSSIRKYWISQMNRTSNLFFLYMFSSIALEKRRINELHLDWKIHFLS